ncbi:hypothetical protein [Burkholderia ubonensis]|uniref:hypothetical protein n=1 Tax=Burkholderia ubonensis TaxID=101571 RepID=UPI000754E106|nr:hypothetical protein [Burkholderia ubonensis]KVN44822.1 hypothetical protein WJ64_27380 [Burkholderia ubonensis]
MKPVLPSGRRRGLPFVLPDDWTPEQALAVYELLDDLLAVIGDFYGDQLHEQLRRQRAPALPTTATSDPLVPF